MGEPVTTLLEDVTSGEGDGGGEFEPAEGAGLEEGDVELLKRLDAAAAAAREKLCTLEPEPEAEGGEGGEGGEGAGEEEEEEGAVPRGARGAVREEQRLLAARLAAVVRRAAEHVTQVRPE